MEVWPTPISTFQSLVLYLLSYSNFQDIMYMVAGWWGKLSRTYTYV